MTTDGEYFEVYKSWIISPGIIMPAQGIYDYNVYLTREELHEDNPRYRAETLEDAREWIDEQEHILEERETGVMGTPEERLLRGVFGPQYAGECSRCHKFTAYGTKTWDGMMLCPRCFALELREKYGVDIDVPEEEG